MKRILQYCIILLSFYLTFNQPAAAQKIFSKENILHKSAMEEFEKGRIDEAEKLFRLSVSEYNYPASYFQLGKLYKQKETVKGNILARKYFEMAIQRDPGNIEYRKALAVILEKNSSKMAFDVYKKILELDEKNTDALFNMGRIKENDYYEYINSVFQEPESPALSYDKFANADFDEAEKYFIASIKTNPRFIDSYNHLALLYIEAGKPDKALKYLNLLKEKESPAKESFLILGLTYYLLSKTDSSNFAFNKAFGLMDESEKTVYTNLSSKYFSEVNDKKAEPETTTAGSWNPEDPLYLTKYNERLLEHYVRVAYSDLRFSVIKKNIQGWETDRGEILVRYGIPEARIRYRPQISAGGNTSLLLKTDLWIYPDKVFGFTDDYWTGNFRFSAPNPSGRHHSQFAGDSETFIQDLRRNEPESYTPKFNGPVIEVPFIVSQFGNLTDPNNSNTTIVVSYAVESEELSVQKWRKKNYYDVGLFILDKQFNIIRKKLDYIREFSPGLNLNLGLEKNYIVKSVETEYTTNSLNFAFELIRNKDKAVSTNHDPLVIKDFSGGEFKMSDILLCENISRNNKSLPVHRANYYLLPNPFKIFKSINNIYLYYEVYNLVKNENGTSDFEQELTIEKIDESAGSAKVLNSVLKILGLSTDENELVVKTDYSSSENSAQVYLKLDMHNYEKGKYRIHLKLKDKSTGKITDNYTEFLWD